LASAYNTTPKEFADARSRLAGHVDATGKDPDRFPNAIATMFLPVQNELHQLEMFCERVAPLAAA
jgi:hypothetical protein